MTACTPSLNLCLQFSNDMFNENLLIFNLLSTWMAFSIWMHLTITINLKYKTLLLCKSIPFSVHRNVYFSAQLWCSAFSLLYQLSLLRNCKRGAVSSMKCWDYLEWKSQHWFFSNLIKIELENHGKINHYDVMKKGSELES